MRPVRWSRRRAAAVAAIVVALAAYPTFVLGYAWTHVARCDLPGGRNGPLDAYRHTLASAVVAYTLSDAVVAAVTTAMEWRGSESNRMDRHNNAIGAAIGARATAFSQLEPAVRAQVAAGAVDAVAASQTTWRPPDQWHTRWLW